MLVCLLGIMSAGRSLDPATLQGRQCALIDTPLLFVNYITILLIEE